MKKNLILLALTALAVHLHGEVHPATEIECPTSVIPSFLFPQTFLEEIESNLIEQKVREENIIQLLKDCKSARLFANFNSGIADRKLVRISDPHIYAASVFTMEIESFHQALKENSKRGVPTRLTGIIIDEYKAHRIKNGYSYSLPLLLIAPIENDMVSCQLEFHCKVSFTEDLESKRYSGFFKFIETKIIERK